MNNNNNNNKTNYLVFTSDQLRKRKRLPVWKTKFNKKTFVINNQILSWLMLTLSIITYITYLFNYVLLSQFILLLTSYIQYKYSIYSIFITQLVFEVGLIFSIAYQVKNILSALIIFASYYYRYNISPVSKHIWYINVLGWMILIPYTNLLSFI